MLVLTLPSLVFPICMEKRTIPPVRAGVAKCCAVHGAEQCPLYCTQCQRSDHFSPTSAFLPHLHFCLLCLSQSFSHPCLLQHVHRRFHNNFTFSAQRGCIRNPLKHFTSSRNFLSQTDTVTLLINSTPTLLIQGGFLVSAESSLALRSQAAVNTASATAEALGW